MNQYFTYVVRIMLFYTDYISAPEYSCYCLYIAYNFML